MNTHDNPEPDIIGTCCIRQELRVGSPELQQLLSNVTVDGFADPQAFARIEGEALDKMIAARREYLYEKTQQELCDLSDVELIGKCMSGSRSVSQLAQKITESRISAGNDSTFVCLAKVVQSLPSEFNYPLGALLDRLVKEHRAAMSTKNAEQLQDYVGKVVTDRRSFAALERIDFLLERKKDLVNVDAMPLSHLMNRYTAGDFDHDKQVKKRALVRLKAETLSSTSLRSYLPRMPLQALVAYLSGLGVPLLGHFPSRSPTCTGHLWEKAVVLEKIKYTTAHLLFRAKCEFRGQLPEALHSAILLAAKDEYQQKYVEWLASRPQRGAMSAVSTATP